MPNPKPRPRYGYDRQNYQNKTGNDIHLSPSCFLNWNYLLITFNSEQAMASIKASLTFFQYEILVQLGYENLI
jgi:hypothetical protein